MKKQKYLKWIIFSIALAINLFILINSFIFGDASTAESNAITSTAADAINSVSPGSITKGNFEFFVGLIRKVFGHFALFGLSGVFTGWTLYLFLKDTKWSYHLTLLLYSLIIGFAIAWLSEFIQLFIPGRSGSTSDVAIDLIGYFIGVLLVIFANFIAKKPIFSKQVIEEK